MLFNCLHAFSLLVSSRCVFSSISPLKPIPTTVCGKVESPANSMTDLENELSKLLKPSGCIANNQMDDRGWENSSPN